MTLSELRNLSFNNVGSWPAAVKAVAVLLVMVAILGASWNFSLKDQQSLLEKARSEEEGLRKAFEDKQRKAANLTALKRQLADIQQSFGDMLKRLPNKTEVAALLVDISQQGLGAGLEFELFKPGQEQPADFYVQLPIQIRVTGTYHQFGAFISGISDLPRIVTSHNIQIKQDASAKAGAAGTTAARLVMETTAKTYRYMDDEEEAAVAAAAAAKSKKKSGSKTAKPAAAKPKT